MVMVIVMAVRLFSFSFRNPYLSPSASNRGAVLPYRRSVGLPQLRVCVYFLSAHVEVIYGCVFFDDTRLIADRGGHPNGNSSGQCGCVLGTLLRFDIFFQLPLAR